MWWPQLDDQRLTDVLHCWRDYMRTPDHLAELGYPSTAAGIRFRPGDDFDGMIDSMDHRVALAADAAIDSLPINERTAVYATILPGSKVWRLREAIPVLHERAREMLKIALRARGIE